MTEVAKSNAHDEVRLHGLMCLRFFITIGRVVCWLGVRVLGVEYCQLTCMLWVFETSEGMQTEKESGKKKTCSSESASEGMTYGSFETRLPLTLSVGLFVEMLGT